MTKPAGFFLKHGKRILEACWNAEDNGAWRTVPAALDSFKGVHASTWRRRCRSLRACDPRRKAWEEDVISAAIRDVEAMNAHAKAAFHIFDHAWTAERLGDFEDDALMTFDVVPTRAKTVEAPDGRGQVVLTVDPADHALETPRIAPDRDSLPDLQASDGRTDAALVQTPADGSTPTTAGPNDTTVGVRSGGNSDEDGWDLPA